MIIHTCNMIRSLIIVFIPGFVFISSAYAQISHSVTLNELEKHFYKSFLNEKADDSGYSKIVYGLIHVSPTGGIDSFHISTVDRYGLMLGKAIQTIPKSIHLQFKEPAVLMVHLICKQENDGYFLYDAEKSMHIDQSFLTRLSKLNGRPLYLLGPLEFITFKAVR